MCKVTREIFKSVDVQALHQVAVGMGGVGMGRGRLGMGMGMGMGWGWGGVGMGKGGGAEGAIVVARSPIPTTKFNKLLFY